MANSTTTQRRLYAPACTSKASLFIAAYGALDGCFEAHRYTVDAGSGAYNCRRITGGTGYSLHAYGPGAQFTFWNGRKMATALAVDINPARNPYGPRLVTDMPRSMIDQITGLRTGSGAQVWGWGGYYSRNKDAMHFEIVCSPADLATGIAQHGDEPLTEAELTLIGLKIDQAADRVTEDVKASEYKTRRVLGDVLDSLPDVDRSKLSKETKDYLAEIAVKYPPA